MSNLVSESNIIGIGPRMLKAAERLAPLAGTLNGGIKPFYTKGGSSLSGAMNLVGSTVRNFKFANPIQTTMAAANQPQVYPITSGIWSWIGGLIAEQVGQEIKGDIGSFLGTGGRAAMKFGTTSAFMGILSGYFLEQGAGGGIVGDVWTGTKGLAGGGSQNYRLKQDNPDVVPQTMARGIVSPLKGTEY